MEVGARDVQGFPPLAQPAPRQSYAPMAGKPAPSSHEPPRQWNQAPVTLINSGRIKGGRDGGKRMIQRLNEENGRHENTVLSTWRWCKQGWPRLSQTTDRWPRPRSLLLTVLNKYLFNLIYFSNNLLFCEEAWCCERIYHKSRLAQIRSVGPVKNRDRTLKELFHT